MKILHLFTLSVIAWGFIPGAPTDPRPRRTEGKDGRIAEALPLDKLKEILK